MGIDVNLYAVVSPSPEQLATAEAYFKGRDHGFADNSVYGDPESPVLVLDLGADWRDFPRVEVYTLSRYYGPGYERGHWPAIYGAILTLQAAFPSAPVYYGGDSTDDGELVTQEFLEAMWLHFLGPNGDSYHRRAREWNARYGPLSRTGGES